MVKRERTNTPLQSLVTLNDAQFFEAARALAENALRESPDDFDKRLSYIAQRLVSRDFSDEEVHAIRASHEALLANYRENPHEAQLAINVGHSKPDASLAPVELAAWSALANQLMNLDEVLNK